MSLSAITPNPISKIEGRLNIIENRINSFMNYSREKSFKAEFQSIIQNSDIKPIGIDLLADYIPEEDTIVLENSTVQSQVYGAYGEEKQEILKIIDQYCSEIGVDPELVKIIVQVESAYRPNATSVCGAMGLMQLMPETAESLGVKDAYDIRENLSGGIRLIKSLIDSFDNDIKLALAAYNAGSGRVRKHGGVPPIKETQDYVYKILSAYNPSLL